MVSALREHWEKNGRRGWTRTSDPLLRRQMLYPPELRALLWRFYHPRPEFPGSSLRMCLLATRLSGKGKPRAA